MWHYRRTDGRGYHNIFEKRGDNNAQRTKRAILQFALNYFYNKDLNSQSKLCIVKNEITIFWAGI